MNAITSDAQRADAATDREQVLRELLDEAHARIRSLEAALGRLSEADDRLLGAEGSNLADPPRRSRSAGKESDAGPSSGTGQPIRDASTRFTRSSGRVNTAHPRCGTVR